MRFRLLAFLLLATLAHAAQLTVTWPAPTTGGAPSAYYLERGLGASPSSWTALAALPATTFVYVDSALAGATTYSYRVRAYNAGGMSPYSGVGTNTTLPDIPGAPGSPNVTTPPPAIAITLQKDERIMLSNTTSTVKPNPNDRSMAIPSGMTAVVASK